MVAAAVVLVLVASHAVVEGDFAGKPAFGKQLDGAINGAEADARVSLADQAVKFVGGEVLAGCEKSPQDGVALVSVLESNLLQMPVKNVLGLADVFARDDW